MHVWTGKEGSSCCPISVNLFRPREGVPPSTQLSAGGTHEIEVRCYRLGMFKEKQKPATWCRRSHPRAQWHRIACMRNRLSFQLWLHWCLSVGLWACFIVSSSTFGPGNSIVCITWELVRNAHSPSSSQVCRCRICTDTVSQVMCVHIIVWETCLDCLHFGYFVGKTEENHGPLEAWRL